MPAARLIHPVPTLVARLDRAATRVDPDAREPIQAATFLPAVTIPGQPRWSAQSLDLQANGRTDDSTGYVLYTYVEVRAALAGEDIAIGDRISVQGHLVTEVYVTRIEPMAHYPPDGATMFRAWFKDRRPAKARR